MGAVYLGLDGERRRHAIKVSLASGGDPVERERFRREARLLASLPPHRHVLGVLGVGTEGGLDYCVTDFVDGTTLEALLARGRLEPRRAVELAARVALALDHLHRHGIVHRDLKPANVVVRASDGEPVLIDFGIAIGANDARLSKTGDLLGTPHYMSPEQAEGAREVGPAADVFALGCVLHELLTGEKAFPGATPVEVLKKILLATPPRPSATAPDLPPGIDAIVARTLAKAPGARYASAADAAADLTRVAHAVRPRRVTPARLLVLGVLASVALLALALGLRSRRAAEAAVWLEGAARRREALEAGLRALPALQGALGTDAAAASPALGAALEDAQAWLARTAAPPAGDPTRAALEQSVAAARASERLARNDPAGARAAVAGLPPLDPARLLAEGLADLAASEASRDPDALPAATHAADALAALASTAPPGRLALEATLAAALARASDDPAAARRRLEALVPALVQVPEARPAHEALLRHTIVLGIERADSTDAATAALLEARATGLAPHDLVAAVVSRGRASPQALGRLFVARPGDFDPGAATRLLDRAGPALAAAGDVDGFLDLAAAALRRGLALDPFAWSEASFGPRPDALPERIERRLAARADDWPAALIAACRAAPRPEGLGNDFGGVRARIAIGLGRCESVLATADVPAPARALALVERAALTLWHEGLDALADNSQASFSPAALADLARIAADWPIYRSRCWSVVAYARLLGHDGERALEAAQAAIDAADAREKGLEAAERQGAETVLELPSRAASVRLRRLEAREEIFVYPALSRHPDVQSARLAQLRGLDPEGDRFAVAGVVVRFTAHEDEAGLRAVRAGWAALEGKAGSPGARKRFRDGVLAVPGLIFLADRDAFARAASLQQDLIEIVGNGSGD